MKRTALCLAAALAAASAHAAALEWRSAAAPPIPGRLRVQFELIDPTFPTAIALMSTTGPWLSENSGWLLFEAPTAIRNANTLLGEPPDWQFTRVVYVDPVDAAFRYRPRWGSVHEFALVDVAEFFAAGDAAVTLRVPRHADNYNVITWESLNLGVVERTYPFGTTVPEPAGLALLAVGVMMLRRRR